MTATRGGRVGGFLPVPPVQPIPPFLPILPTASSVPV